MNIGSINTFSSIYVNVREIRHQLPRFIDGLPEPRGIDVCIKRCTTLKTLEPLEKTKKKEFSSLLMNHVSVIVYHV